MADDFRTVLKQYEAIWLGALDELVVKFPFAAACLACVCIDHLGNALSTQRRSTDEHASTYDRYLRKYLGVRYQGAEAFPDNGDMRMRFYRVLRSGLVHEARTDDHLKNCAEAAPAWLSHLDFVPKECSETEAMTISVPWLVRCVKRAWACAASESDASKRQQVADRLRLMLTEGPPPDNMTTEEVSFPRVGSDHFSLSAPAASGMGVNMRPEYRLEELAYNKELRERGKKR